MARKDELGRWGEDRAAAYLRDHGYEIVARNWRCPFGEIDIVALRGATLVVVEVKTRRTVGFGHPFAAVDDQKLHRLWRLARAWVKDHPDQARGLLLRLDIVGVIGEPARPDRVEHLEGVR